MLTTKILSISPRNLLERKEFAKMVKNSNSFVENGQKSDCSFQKYHSIASDVKRIDIATIIVGFKLMIFKFQSKRKNQKYTQLLVLYLSFNS